MAACTICPMTFEDEKFMKMHRGVAHDGMYACFHCEVYKYFKLEAAIKSHYASVHRRVYRTERGDIDLYIEWVRDVHQWFSRSPRVTARTMSACCSSCSA